MAGRERLTSESPQKERFHQHVLDIQSTWRKQDPTYQDQQCFYLPQKVSKILFHSTCRHVPAYIQEEVDSLYTTHPTPLVFISDQIDPRFLSESYSFPIPKVVRQENKQAWEYGMEILLETGIETIASDMKPVTTVFGYAINTNTFSDEDDDLSLSPFIQLQEQLIHDFGTVDRARLARTYLAQAVITHNVSSFESLLREHQVASDINTYAIQLGSFLRYDVRSRTGNTPTREQESADCTGITKYDLPGIIQLPIRGYTHFLGLRKKFAIGMRSLLHEHLHYLSINQDWSGIIRTKKQ